MLIMPIVVGTMRILQIKETKIVKGDSDVLNE